MKLQRILTFILLTTTLFFTCYGALDLLHTRNLTQKTESIKDEVEKLVINGDIQEELANEMMAKTLTLERESKDLEIKLIACESQ